MITRSHRKQARDKSELEGNEASAAGKLMDSAIELELQCGGVSPAAPGKSEAQASPNTAQICFTPQRTLRVRAWLSPEKSGPCSEKMQYTAAENSTSVESVPLTARTARELRRLGVPVPSTLLDRTANGTPHIRGMARRRLNMGATPTPSSVSIESAPQTDVTETMPITSTLDERTSPEAILPLCVGSADANVTNIPGTDHVSGETLVNTVAVDATADDAIRRHGSRNSPTCSPAQRLGGNSDRDSPLALRLVPDVSPPLVDCADHALAVPSPASAGSIKNGKIPSKDVSSEGSQHPLVDCADHALTVPSPASAGSTKNGKIPSKDVSSEGSQHPKCNPTSDGPQFQHLFLCYPAACGYRIIHEGPGPEDKNISSMKPGTEGTLPKVWRIEHASCGHRLAPRCHCKTSLMRTTSSLKEPGIKRSRNHGTAQILTIRLGRGLASPILELHPHWRKRFGRCSRYRGRWLWYR
jgi:hypothetical protein